MSKKFLIYALLTAFVLLQLSEPLFALQKTDSIDQQLKQARSDYYEGKFEQAQQTVLTLLKEARLNNDQQFEALIILAEIRHALNDEPGARKIIKRILAIRPDYNPSIKEEPPSFVALVQDERQQLSPPKTAIYRKKNFWFISGAALIGTIGILLLGGKENRQKSQILPEPPNWPE